MPYQPKAQYNTVPQDYVGSSLIGRGGNMTDNVTL